MNSQVEERVAQALANNDIQFFRDYPIPPTRMSFDFFLPKLKIMIEVNGVQHFRLTRYYSPKRLEQLQENDTFKRKWAWKFGYKVIDLNGIDLTDAYDKIIQLMFYLKQGKYVSWKVI